MTDAPKTDPSPNPFDPESLRLASLSRTRSASKNF